MPVTLHALSRLSPHADLFCAWPQVVQGIKVLGANVRHREKERAERATLVTQERLVKGKVRTSRCPSPGTIHLAQTSTPC